MSETKVLKVEEVARMLRIGPRTVYRMIERGELRAVRAGRLILVPVDAVEAYLRGEGQKHE